MMAVSTRVPRTMRKPTKPIGQKETLSFSYSTYPSGTPFPFCIAFFFLLIHLPTTWPFAPTNTHCTTLPVGFTLCNRVSPVRLQVYPFGIPCRIFVLFLAFALAFTCSWWIRSQTVPRKCFAPAVPSGAVAVVPDCNRP